MDYNRLLRMHKLKATPQRLAMLACIDKAGHIAIEPLYERLKRSCPTLSLATVYKNLMLMTEAGIVTELGLPGKKQQFELTQPPHMHLHCTCCDTLTDLKHPIESMVRSNAAAGGYRLENVSVVLSGVCPRCQRQVS